MGRETLAVTSDFFFYGTMTHLPLIEIVLERVARAEPAYMQDHALYAAEGGLYPLIVQERGVQAVGLLVYGLSDAEKDRLDLYEGAFGYQAQQMPVVLPGRGPVSAMVYYPGPENWGQGPGAPWHLAEWQAQYGAEFEAALRDLMAMYGVKPPRQLAARFHQMLTRGASRVRAAQGAPTTLRHRAGSGDVVVKAAREPYARFFAVEELDLSFRRFDGALSPVVTRASFVASDAVTVLPYDPVRDRVLVVDQFRAGPFVRGDAQAWQIEAIAGRIDPGESPEAAARREAVEEAGLHLRDLLPVAQYYPSPGCMSEFLYSYVAVTNLPDSAAGVFGVAGEAEDIRGHLIGFDQLMALVGSGEVGNAPLVLTAFWLANNRARLRGV